MIFMYFCEYKVGQMRIAVYGRRRQEEFSAELAAFFERLGQGGAEIVMHRKIYDVLVHTIPHSLAAVRKVTSGHDFSADAAVSLGGDGTFLRTAMWIGDKQIPILGVNTGHLGYLASATIADLPAVADELLEGRFDVDDRRLIEVCEPKLDTWPYALNEVAVSKDQSASMIEAHTTISGRPLADYKADGLIVCTPTGSTAYNLSVGGPIIEPCTPVWCLSPIAAHTLSMRPLVVCDTAELDIVVEGRALEYRIALDGRATTLPIGTKVVLRKAPFLVKVINRAGHGFPMAMRDKLGWS